MARAHEEKLSLADALQPHYAANPYELYRRLREALARLESEIAFSTLLHRFPDLRLASEDVEREGGMVFRGLKRLPLLID